MMITAIILTRNEAAHITECLSALKWASARLVVDSGSTDQTCALAADSGAEVITHSFVNFSDQRNFAMSCVQTPWILFIDADERVSPKLAHEIQTVVRLEAAAYRIPRQNYFFGKKLKYSGSQQDAPLRLFPRDAGVWVQPVHEFFKTHLAVRQLTSCLEHHSTQNLGHYLEKLRCYVPFEAETLLANNRRVFFWDPCLRALAKFVFLYFFKLGFLDGLTGLQFSILSSYYDFKKYSLFRSLRGQRMKRLTDPEIF